MHKLLLLRRIAVLPT